MLVCVNILSESSYYGVIKEIALPMGELLRKISKVSTRLAFYHQELIIILSGTDSLAK